MRLTQHRAVRLAAVAGVAILAVAIPSALAVHDKSVFELEGNAVDNAAAGADWANVYDDVFGGLGVAPSGASAQAFVPSSIEGPAADTTYWKGGGSKDVRDLSAAGVTSTFWEHSATDSAPDTDDILDAFAAAYNVGGDLLLYFGMDRFATEGSSQVGFWFFKSRHALNADGTFAGVHDVGDILVLSDFTTGGKISNVRAFTWVGAGGDTGGTLQSLPSATGGDCEAPAPAGDNACATVNSPTDVATSPWFYDSKTSDGVDNDFPPGALFEGGINVSKALSLSGDICFSQFLAETRSSGSAETAQLKDFATGRFELCDARITIAPDDVNEVGEPHTFTVTAEKKSGGTGFVPATVGNVDATLTGSAGATPVIDAAASTCDDNQPSGDNLDANGQCTIVFSSATVGTVTGHASANITLGGDTLIRATSGTGGNGGDAIKHFVDGSISIAPDGVNEVGENHTFTINVTPQAAGTTVTAVSITPTVTPAPSSMDASSCQSIPAAGPYTCTVTISNDSAGTFTATATASITYNDGKGHSDTIVRSTSGSGGNSAPAVKRFVDAAISIAPDDTNGIGEPHTFTIEVTPSPAGSNVTSVAIAGTVDPAPGESSSTCGAVAPSNDLMTCTLTVNSNVAGTFVANATVTLTFTKDGKSDSVTRSTSGNSGPGGSGSATKIYIAGTLVWLKHDNHGALLGGATFQVCRTHGFDSDDSTFPDVDPDACQSVTDNVAPDADPTAGQLELTDLFLGRYTIKETQAPPGYALDPDTETVELTLTNPDNSVLLHPSGIPLFVDVELFRLIVLTCDEPTNGLVVSEVDLNGSIKDTIDGVPPALVGKVTEAELCNLGGASYGNLDAGTYVPSVKLPK